MFHLEINRKKHKNYNYLNRYESTFKDIMETNSTRVRKCKEADIVFPDATIFLI